LVDSSRRIWSRTGADAASKMLAPTLSDERSNRLPPRTIDVDHIGVRSCLKNCSYHDLTKPGLGKQALSLLRIFVFTNTNRRNEQAAMTELQMHENDYPLLTELEETFERNDVSHFISFLEKKDGLPLLLRVHAVCMLEHIGNEDVVRPLCEVLAKDSSPLTRHEAAFTLGQLGYRSAVPALVEAMMNNPSPIVRHESSVALSSLGDDSVLPELKKAIDDRDEDVANSALIAFEYLTYLNRKKENAKGVPASKPKIRL